MVRTSVPCAIYTRKSSEEGLEQGFNSLDAQFEACVSYVSSQKHEGWKLVNQRYDDGGVSGGTLERPGLQRLLADIEAGRVQMVVVYKIDRLTRSLADFAKLVDRLEAANCSFVSVTQAFNTSSSMGRLTLNVLLSFAQFEREVTAERIRDKIAASKQKGLWMGGVCPLGYDKHPDPQTRTLIVNEDEASTVIKLYELYDQLGCLRAVEHKARQLGLISKRQVYGTGRVAGGKVFSRGQIYYIFRNPLYIGQIRHKDKTYPGQHPAIIGQGLWDRVQDKLTRASQRKRGKTNQETESPFALVGKVFDETGDRLTPSHTMKGRKKYKYYVSNRLIGGAKDASAWRLSASMLEKHLATIIADHLEAHRQRMTLSNNIDLQKSEKTSKLCRRIAADLRGANGRCLQDIVANVQISSEAAELNLNQGVIAERLGLDVDDLNHEVTKVTSPWQIKRRGIEKRIVIANQATGPDSTLITLLDQAHDWVDQLKRSVPLKIIAEQRGVTPAYIRTRSKLAFLAPRVQEAILRGAIDPEFTANRLTNMKIPTDWAMQESLFLKF